MTNLGLTALLVLSCVVFIVIVALTVVALRVGIRVLGYIDNIIREKAWRDLYKDE